MSYFMSNALDQPAGYLTGQLLIAMPQMDDPRFARSVVYLCAHSPEGAMGLILNRRFDALTFPELLGQLEIEPTARCEDVRVHFGGPVEAARGFVLHTPDYQQETTLVVDEHVGLTATIDVLRAIAGGAGPRRSLLALGYAGWGEGQLDAELLENVWLTVPADEELLFSVDIDHKWEMAVSRLGIDSRMLSGDAGHA